MGTDHGAIHLAHLTTEDARAAQRAAKVALLPVGAVEQHGPHLTMLTDARIAEAFAHRLGAELGSDAIVCPLLPYGLSEHHERFAGTLSLTPPTFIAVMLDLVASLKAQGIDKVIIVNGHGGNIDALSLVVRRARSELGVLAASMMWAKLADDVCAEEAAGPAYGHACELETSLAMVLAPELVKVERIRPATVRSGLNPISAPHGQVDIAVRFDELTEDGVYGDPTKANTETGERILTSALQRAVAFARRFLHSGTVV
ncbi:creatininase family protein [Phytoactinopolyspora halotolerans]|uniref:Creatininase family protein n=1 Tax=Phytoactinopolyspora halotolerans TaxID=1981512 RepID=A0A6L9SDT8_9ACTN|nr:creatininase family protein [Phytoactinopolyspora halotolerans]NEE03267.1 creatininase family protein [Phytoactinopolyspora halotolerans]